MLLPASITEILTNLVGLKLEPTTTAAVLGAILAPLLRSEAPTPAPIVRPRPKPRRATRPRKKPKRQAARSREARERARAALKANPDASLTTVAKAAGVSHGTTVNACDDLAAEARKQARKEAKRRSHEKSKTAQPERRQRAQRFLRDTLAGGPRPVTTVEAAASKAHVDPPALEQARADLGIVVNRGNAGRVMAVQWSLPG